MKRVLVLGSSGAGKSTFAKELGSALDIETIHLDSFYWKPNWTPTEPDEWAGTLNRLLARESWVMDGNYPDSLAFRLKYADTAIFLERSRIQSLVRCVGRYLKYRGQSRPELAPGCTEKIDLDFLRWIWNYPRDVKPRIAQALESQPNVDVVLLRGDSEARDYLSSLRVV